MKGFSYTISQADGAGGFKYSETGLYAGGRTNEGGIGSIALLRKHLMSLCDHLERVSNDRIAELEKIANNHLLPSAVCVPASAALKYYLHAKSMDQT